jgi:hypothetical protein
MSDVDQVIEMLLAKWPAGFRNKHLAEALTVSRPRASKVLASRVLSGELVRAEGSRRKYIRGPGSSEAHVGVVRGALRKGFWMALAGDSPHLAYLAFCGLGLWEVRTRNQVRAALRGLIDLHSYLVIDFEGVRAISEAAARELFVKLPQYSGTWVQSINLEPSVARTVLNVVRRGD